MIRLLAALFLAAAALPSLAQDLPALHRVTGVAAGDVLNIRQEPGAGSPVIGQFGPGETGIEVTALDSSGRWGRVNTGETAGWAALRYLQAMETDPAYPLARRLHCYGTEPFWSLEIEQGGQARFLTAEGQNQLHPAAGALAAARGRPDRFAIRLAGGLAAVLRREDCGDGMSDRAYGLGIDLLSGRDGLTLYSGCCSLQP